MNNLSRNELIKALVKGLKLDDNIFNYQAVAEDIESIQEKDFMDFYKKTMAENTYGNGLQAIMKVAETFKPIVTKDDVTIQAEELIALVYSMNNQVFNDAQSQGVLFDDLMEIVKFPKLDDATIAILNQVKPYTDYKRVISNISSYENGSDQLRAFKNAIEYSSSYAGAIECSKVKRLLK